MVEELVLHEGSVNRVVRTILVVDVVESVRLIEHFERDTIRRWRALVEKVVQQILPAHEGRLVKSLGDGMMLEFPSVHRAIGAAFEIQLAALVAGNDVTPEQRIALRLGAHVGNVVADERDIYGHSVNLAARLAALAGPGEIVVSADVCDLLVPVLDAEIEDLGACYLKHVSKPVRAYRIGPAGQHPVLEPRGTSIDPRATVAVIPFASRTGEPQDEILGPILADDVTGQLSRSAEINVVSRLSTAAFVGRAVAADKAGAHLSADYIISGSYHVSADRLTLSVELADVRTMQVAWSGALKGSVKGVVTGADPLVSQLVAAACAALMLHEFRRSQGKSPPTLESHTLLLSSITLMHRMLPQAAERAQRLLQTLIERAPRVAAPYAWLGKWHVLRVTQGWSQDPLLDGRAALDNARRALDLDATLSLALTVEGQVNTYVLKQLDVAEQSYEAALRENPNDALAWLLKGTLHAFKDEGKEAVRHTRRAMKLSPLDPLRYYFDSLAATAALSAGQYQRAQSLAERSLRLNRTHASTLRVMVVALWHLERQDEARARAAEVLRLEPAFTVTKYLERSPSAPFPIGRFIASTLEQAGIPK